MCIYSNPRRVAWAGGCKGCKIFKARQVLGVLPQVPCVVMGFNLHLVGNALRN